MKNFKFHKAWLMLFGCICLMSELPTVTTLLSFFVKPVCDAFYFQRGAFTIYVSITAIMTALSMPLWGNIINKIGIKAVVVISGTITGIGLIAMSTSTSLIQFYIAAFFVGFATPAASMLPTSIIINNWFVEKKGLAMGIAMSFSGVSAAILSPIVVRVIGHGGWSYGYILLGLTSLVLTIPAAFFIIKERPADVGLTAYGAQELEPGRQDFPEVTGVSSKVALKSGAFFGIAAATLLVGFSASGFSAHVPAHLANKNFPLIMIGSIMSILMIGLIVSKIGAGWLNDRIGTSMVSTITLVCAGAGFFLLTIADNYAIAIAACALYSAGLAYTTVFYPLLTSKMFGTRDFNSIYPFMSALNFVGYAAGAPLFGIIFDKTGSYTFGLYGAAIMSIAAAVLAALSIKASKKLPTY